MRKKHCKECKLCHATTSRKSSVIPNMFWLHSIQVGAIQVNCFNGSGCGSDDDDDDDDDDNDDDDDDDDYNDDDDDNDIAMVKKEEKRRKIKRKYNLMEQFGMMYYNKDDIDVNKMMIMN